ncbi:hypothetical protein J3Q64DRAFT_1731491 [Phycomyces blakesleeanus]|uniref:Uncharacterized protein n=1 Tax=Phycomyces blakesleeanus TaxID=4837 RepID=A0ABR3B3C9_PHYBL
MRALLLHSICITYFCLFQTHISLLPLISLSIFFPLCFLLFLSFHYILFTISIRVS